MTDSIPQEVVLLDPPHTPPHHTTPITTPSPFPVPDDIIVLDTPTPPRRRAASPAHTRTPSPIPLDDSPRKRRRREPRRQSRHPTSAVIVVDDDPAHTDLVEMAAAGPRLTRSPSPTRTQPQTPHISMPPLFRSTRPHSPLSHTRDHYAAMHRRRHRTLPTRSSSTRQPNFSTLPSTVREPPIPVEDLPSAATSAAPTLPLSTRRYPRPHTRSHAPPHSHPHLHAIPHSQAHAQPHVHLHAHAASSSHNYAQLHSIPHSHAGAHVHLHAHSRRTPPSRPPRLHIGHQAISTESLIAQFVDASNVDSNNLAESLAEYMPHTASSVSVSEAHSARAHSGTHAYAMRASPPLPPGSLGVSRVRASGSSSVASSSSARANSSARTISVARRRSAPASSSTAPSSRARRMPTGGLAPHGHSPHRDFVGRLMSMMQNSAGFDQAYFHGFYPDQALDYEQLIRLDEQLVREKNRAEKSDIESLPTITATAKDKEIRCCVCMCDVEEGEELRVLPCSHKYHKKCIDEWLTYNGCCPVDKKRIAPYRSRRRCPAQHS